MELTKRIGRSLAMITIARRWLPALALALAACTPTRWEHPTLGEAQTQADMTDCQRQAWAEAQHEVFFFGSPFAGPRPYRGRDGRIHWRYYDPYWRANDRLFRESQLRDFCMRNKGYHLVPAK